MSRFKIACSTAVLGLSVLAGCASSQYDPKVPDSVLSSYAAKSKYPEGAATMKSPDVFYNVADNGVITVYNTGNTSMMQFDLWVNKQYVIAVTNLPPHTSIPIGPEKVYNSGGTNLSAIKPENYHDVQISAQGHVYDLNGPVKPM